MKYRTIIVIFIISLLSQSIIINPSQFVTVSPESDSLLSGAYVDKVLYRYMGPPDQTVSALEAGTIDTLYGYINPMHEDTLKLESDIELHYRIQNGYRQIAINCHEYPLNISGLRRAFAYAFNKTRVINEILDGNAIEHDSLVPLSSTWCIEDNLPWHYYTNQSDIGNQILDDLNFLIDGETGFRLAPDGSPFDIVVEYGEGPLPYISSEISQVAVDALRSLHIDAQAQGENPAALIARLANHDNYDMIFYGDEFPVNDVRWLAYDYWSEYADAFTKNPSNFKNETYDEWRNQLLNGTTYEEIFEASAAMQEILHYNVPCLVVCVNRYIDAFRTDEFTGHVDDLAWGVAGPWTNLKVHINSERPFGGTFTIGISETPSSFNIFNPTTLENLMISNLYSSLYKIGPDFKQYPDLSESVLVERHADNPSVPSDCMWLTFDIRSNAIWSDLIPLTAHDVAFTFKYYFESFKFGNPASVPFTDFVAAEVFSPYKVRIECNSVSYWDVLDYMNAKIIPKHIFNDETGIGYDGWLSWNPVFNSGHPHVTCGPFYLSHYENDGSYEFSRNLLYHWPSGAKPKVLASTDMTYVQGTTGNQIHWIVEDDNPLSYSIFQNDEMKLATIWNESDIIYNIDGLAAGIYNYTLILLDNSSNIVTDTVWVTVVPPNSFDNLIIGVSLGVAALVLLGGIILYKKR